MRGMRLSNFLLYGFGLLLSVAASATPSHAACAEAAQFNTPNLVFSIQPVGQSGLTQTATLTFTTACPGTISNIIVSVSGTNAGDFSAAGNGATPCNAASTFSIDSGVPASCTIGATFTPTATGTRTATVTATFTVTGEFSNGPVSFNVVGGDEVAYVTTGVGGQVLAVDGTTGAFQILSNGPACGTPPCFNPTGAVVGPDGKIYVTDQVNSEIWRMNQDGSQLEAVYLGSGCGGDGSPCRVEGPSFSSSGAGDLYFNTYYNTGLYVLPGIGTTAFGGSFPSPTSVAGTVDGGIGTAFDANGNLLAADVEFTAVWTLPPPYSPSTAPSQLINNGTSAVGLESPAGIALNKLTGMVFVADPQAKVNDVSFSEIMQVVPPVSLTAPATTTTYYTFNTEACDSADFVEYIQSDMTGVLFATTSTSPISFGDAGISGCGKVWRIDPPESSPNCIGSPTPCATLLVDLNAAYTSGIAAVCFSPCGLNSAQAIGVAMPPTPGPTQSVPLSASGGTYSVGIPLGCAPTRLPPNNCSSTITGVYPAGIYSSGDMMNITFNEVGQAKYAVNVGGGPYALTTLAPVAGWGGNGIVPSLVCLNGSGSACDDPVTPGTSYEIFTTWQTTQMGYCGLTPHLLRGDPVGGPYTFLVDTLVPGSCEVEGEPSAGTKGKSSCTSSSSSSCASDWLNSTGPVTGSTSGITATATITSPANGATFLLNQSETAAFSCGPPSIVVFCPGIVTNPAYPSTVISVANGGPLPTSLIGTNTLSVNPNVDGGSPGAGATAQYTVVQCQDVGLSFNPDTVAVGKSTKVSTSLQSCNGSLELAVIQFDLTGPLGKSCAIVTTPQLSLPAILGNKPVDFNFEMKIPNGACAGTYTVTSNTYVKGALVSTTSSSLVVTAH